MQPTHLVSRPRSPLRRPTSLSTLKEGRTNNQIVDSSNVESKPVTRLLSTAALPDRSPTGSPFQRTPSLAPVRSLSSKISTDSISSGQGNVKVLVRARPFLQREIAAGSPCLLSMNSDTGTTTLHSEEFPGASSTLDGFPLQNRTKGPREFVFDESLWSVDESTKNPFVGQEQLYATTGKEFLDHSFSGYNTCIFAYGQTGSGKSYTMIGTEKDPGIIPQTCYDLFQRVKRMTTRTTAFTVKVTFFEIYNENVYDLLAPRTTTSQPVPLKVRESPVDGPYVKDLSSHAVHDFREVEELLKIGNKQRATAATNMNSSSSRSHAVFTLNLKKIESDPVLDETTEEMNSRVRFVDLAGSERANSTGASGSRLREGANINRSLTTLGRVINILSESALSSKKKDLVPYRDSTLTWLLKDSLGGNSKTAMIACISPCDYDETLSTLRYASQAKHIRTRAVVNQDIISAAERDQKLIEMQDTITKLQDSLAATTNSQKQQSDTQMQELEKFRKVIQFYEDRAEIEGKCKLDLFSLYISTNTKDHAESKRRAILQENDALKIHNRLMTGHVKEIKQQSPFVYLPTNLADEWALLLSDVASFRDGLALESARFIGRPQVVQSN